MLQHHLLDMTSDGNAMDGENYAYESPTPGHNLNEQPLLSNNTSNIDDRTHHGSGPGERIDIDGPLTDWDRFNLGVLDFSSLDPMQSGGSVRLSLFSCFFRQL